MKTALLLLLCAQLAGCACWFHVPLIDDAQCPGREEAPRKPGRP